MKSNTFIYSLILIIPVLGSCVSIKPGEYIRKFKGGHNEKIIIENDSILRFERNVSMLYEDIKGKYLKQGRIIYFIPEYNQTVNCYDTIPFYEQKIRIITRNRLEIDGVTFKYQR